MQRIIVFGLIQKLYLLKRKSAFFNVNK